MSTKVIIKFPREKGWGGGMTVLFTHFNVRKHLDWITELVVITNGSKEGFNYPSIKCQVLRREGEKEQGEYY
jgi:hypothetical protein